MVSQRDWVSMYVYGAWGRSMVGEENEDGWTDGINRADMTTNICGKSRLSTVRQIRETYTTRSLLFLLFLGLFEHIRYSLIPVEEPRSRSAAP